MLPTEGRNRECRNARSWVGRVNGTTRFLWGGTSEWQALEEQDGSGNLIARYTYAPGYVDAVARQQRDLNADGDFGDSDEVVWYHSNIIYSVCALSDSSESVVERYRYDAYGAATVLDADGTEDTDGLSDVHNPHTFTARRLDSASGLMQYRNRYYDAAHGRFVSRDPSGYQDGSNLYGYVTQRPTSATDPMGLARWEGHYLILSIGELWNLCYTHCSKEGEGGSEYCYEACCTAMPTAPQCNCGRDGGGGGSGRGGGGPGPCRGGFCGLSFGGPLLKLFPGAPAALKLLSAGTKIPWGKFLKTGGFLAVCRCGACIAALNIQVATCAIYNDGEDYTRCVCMQLRESWGTNAICKICTFGLGDPVQWARDYIGCDDLGW